MICLANAPLWFVSSVIELGSKYIMEIEQEIMLFFWREGRHAILKEKLEMSLDQGGSGLENTRNMITIQRLMGAETAGNWMTLAMYHLGKYSKLDIGIDRLSVFYGTAVKAWSNSDLQGTNQHRHFKYCESRYGAIHL